MSTKIAVVGGGSWGTALTKILVTNGHKVHWYMHSEASLRHLTYYGRNLNYLSQVQFDLKNQNILNFCSIFLYKFIYKML